MVRLVRACGSKPLNLHILIVTSAVRLVRACGSKQIFNIFTGISRPVRLVRACGSKPFCDAQSFPAYIGQARKSLWIETRTHALYDRTAWVRLVRACGSKLVSPDFEYQSAPGQARKSLWIETIRNSSLHPDKRGQARKSLWIETGFQSCQSLKDKVRLVRACGSKQERCGGTD